MESNFMQKLLTMLFVLVFTGTVGANAETIESGELAFNVYTAEGTYSIEDGILTLNFTNSDFECAGPEVGMEQFILISITETTMIWEEPEGDQMIWTRDGGPAGDLVGTWMMEEDPNSYEAIFDPDGMFVVTGQIVECEYYEGNYYYLNVTGNANGHIEFGRSTGELWYEGFSVTGDGAGFYSGVEAVLPFATRSGPLKYLPPQVGQTWTSTGDSNGYQVDSHAEVVSLSESVPVTAGTFNNCAKVDENLSYPNGYTPGQRYPVKFERWFCPGIGPAKFISTEDDSSQYTGELTSYQNITSDPADYFPLGLNYSWTFTMNDGSSADWVVTCETVYDAEAFSARDSSGYWVELIVDDKDNKASSVSAIGPGIAGSLELSYDPEAGRWTSWQSAGGNPAFGSTPPPLPLIYTFTITDPDGTSCWVDNIEYYVDVFATNLSPSGGETVAGNPVFSWTGVTGDYSYGVELNDASWNRVWEVHGLSTTSTNYDGPPLTIGSLYWYSVVVSDGRGNISLANESFVYGGIDTDGDGISDNTDNCALTFNPGQQDTDSDGYGNICDADLDNDGVVGFQDYNIFKAAWLSNSSSPNWNADADFDSDGTVGFQDFNILKSRWLTSAPWE